MKQILHILRYKFLAFLRPDSKVTFSYILKNICSGSIYTAFAVGAFLFSKMLIKFLLIEIIVGQFLLHEFISMVLFIFFISINIGNVIVSYATLYKSAEVNYFLTKPIDPSKIFAIKFLDNFFYSSSTLLMILFALLLGYAFYFRLGIWQFLLLLINFIPYMISAGSLGIIILLLVIKSADKFGVRRVLYSLVISYVSVIVLFFNLNSPKALITTVMKLYPFFNKDKYLGGLIPTVIKYLPNNWLSQTAYSIVQNNYLSALSYSYLQLTLSVILFSTAFILGKKYYFETWLLNVKLSTELNSKRKEKRNSVSFSRSTFLENKIEAIAMKDILLFLREPSQVIHLSILMFLIAIFATSVAGIKYVGLGNFYLQTMIYLSIFIFNLLLITTLSLRFIFPMISLEGLVLWKIKSSPIKISQIILSKLFYPGVIILFISVAICFFSNIRFRTPMFIFALIITITASITIIVINLGMGGSFVNYKEKNPIRLSSSQGASLSFLISLIYMLFLIVILFKPFSNLFLARMLHQRFHVISLFWYYLPILGLSIIMIMYFLRMVNRALKKDF
jgi:ABC-2 type transport system permease protein